MVIRPLDVTSQFAFSDNVVTKVTDRFITLARPYATGHLLNTACGTCLIGLEKYDVDPNSGWEWELLEENRWV